jgi:hypothetical protein
MTKATKMSRVMNRLWSRFLFVFIWVRNISHKTVTVVVGSFSYKELSDIGIRRSTKLFGVQLLCKVV